MVNKNLKLYNELVKDVQKSTLKEKEEKEDEDEEIENTFGYSKM